MRADSGKRVSRCRPLGGIHACPAKGAGATLPTVSIAAPDARLPPTATDDVDYVRANFRPMREAVRAFVEGGVLPQATYVLPDGTPMVPPDHEVLLDEAGGDPDAVAAVFRDRFVAAGGDPARAEEEHAAWLSGEYGACLRTTTPEAIVAKDSLVTAITALLARPTSADDGWRAAVRGAVDALDCLERPFARYDRERFRRPSFARPADYRHAPTLSRSLVVALITGT